MWYFWFENYSWKTTKKKFIKLIMQRRVQRNEAERLAARVQEFGSYTKLFRACNHEMCKATRTHGSIPKAIASGWSLTEAMKTVEGTVKI